MQRPKEPLADAPCFTSSMWIVERVRKCGFTAFSRRPSVMYLTLTDAIRRGAEEVAAAEKAEGGGEEEEEEEEKEEEEEAEAEEEEEEEEGDTCGPSS